MRPCDVGANALHPFLKESSALAPSKRRNARSFVLGLVLELNGTPEQIKVKPCARIDAAQHALPAVHYAVQLLGCLTV